MYINPYIENSPFPLNLYPLKNTQGSIQNTVKTKNTAAVLNIEYFLLKQWFSVIKLIIKTSVEGKIYAYSIAVTPKYFQAKNKKFKSLFDFSIELMEVLYQKLKTSTTI